MEKLQQRLTTILASRNFFLLVLLLFVLQSLWIVGSAAYPMAFDEAFHFGVIQLYAGQILPFMAELPPGAEPFSAIHRDVSFLYHYLMSWPFRLISALTGSQVAQVVFLRLINVALFTYSLVLFKKVFHRAGVSEALANLSLLLFTLIPIVPLLAAQINYDNLLMVAVAWLMLLVAGVVKSFQSDQMPVSGLASLAVLSLFAAVVKQAALPIVTVAIVFVLYLVFRKFRRHSRKELADAVKAGWQSVSSGMRLALLILFLLGSVVFIERYGLNLLHYGTLTPKCDQVLNIEQCLEFGPYERGYNYRQQVSPEFSPDLTYHAETWAKGMWYRLFFMINGDLLLDRYQNFSPLPLPALTAVAIFTIGVAAAVWKHKAVFKKRPLIVFLASTFVFYALVLWLKNFIDYSQTGRPAALNGRYLLPVLPALIAVLGQGMSELFRNRPNLKVVLAVATLLLFLQGGGVISFIVRSHQTWYWPSETVLRVNRAAENALHPLIFGSRQQHLDFVDR